MRINKKHLHLCQPLRIIPNKNTQLKKKKQKAKKAIGKSKCKTRSPNKCKEKATVLEKAKKSKRKSKCKKNGKGKKGEKKANNKQKKRLCFFVAFLFFFKNMEKAEKSKSFFAFSVAFFYFRICTFFASFKSLISWSAFLDCFLLLFVYAGSG